MVTASILEVTTRRMAKNYKNVLNDKKKTPITDESETYKISHLESKIDRRRRTIEPRDFETFDYFFLPTYCSFH